MASATRTAILVGVLGCAAAASAQPRPKPPAPAPATAPKPPAPAPAPTPAAPPAAAPAGDNDADGNDVDALRQEYLKLRDELFQSRARAATVASAVYSSQVEVRLTYTTGRFYSVRRATVRLDGANVFDDTAGAIAGNDAVRFTGWIAPGRHLLTVRIEAAGKDDDRFTSATESTVVVEAVAGKDLVIVARTRDGGDIPYQWKRNESGTYRLAVDIDVKTRARPEGPAKAAPARAAAARAKP